MTTDRGSVNRSLSGSAYRARTTSPLSFFFTHWPKPTMNRLTIATTILALLSLHQACAQAPAAIGQVDAVQQRRQLAESAAPSEIAAPELFPGETSDVGPQSVLRFKPRKKYFEAQADVQYFYTDNMLLTENNKESVDVLVSTAEVALAPDAYPLFHGLFSPRLGYHAQWFDFGLADGGNLGSTTFKLNDFDFNSQTAFTDAQWRYGDWIVEAGFDFRRLLTTSDYDQFYREYVPRWALRYIFDFQAAGAFALAYEGDYRITDSPSLLSSDLLDRTDHSLLALYTVPFFNHAVLQPYYRVKYTHFTGEEERDDIIQSVGLAAYYFFTPNISLRAFIDYETLDSSEDVISEYDRFDVGGGLNLTLRF
jgi:hypothetical protein